jgi:hypothetical protein
MNSLIRPGKYFSEVFGVASPKEVLEVMVVDLFGSLQVRSDYDANWYLLNPAINAKHVDTSFYVVSLPWSR